MDLKLRFGRIAYIISTLEVKTYVVLLKRYTRASSIKRTGWICALSTFEGYSELVWIETCYLIPTLKKLSIEEMLTHESQYIRNAATNNLDYSKGVPKFL